MQKPTLYRPVRTGKRALSEQVAEQIIDLVSSGQLQTGSRLPPLQELASHLGVSRTAAREAIKLLDAWGIVAVKPGVGTFVVEMPADALTVPLQLSAELSPDTLRDLHQLRQALEPEIAALAATNAKPKHIEALEEAICRMDEALSDIATRADDYIAADQEFHSTLAEATGNRLFLIVSHPIVALVENLMHVARRTPGAPERGQHFHGLLLRHVKAADADGAREAMHAHLRQAWSDAHRQAPGAD